MKKEYKRIKIYEERYLPIHTYMKTDHECIEK